MTISRRVRVREALANFAPYHPIEPVSVLAERHGFAVHDIVKLDANENPYGPVPKVASLLSNAELAAQYPDPNQSAARQVLSDYTNVPAARIVLGNGSDELIDLICRAVLEPGESAVSFPPTFAMYRFYTELAGGVLVELERDGEFAIPGEAALTAAGARIAFVASPNNPTGQLAFRESVIGLLETGVLVVLDEAYFEFAGRTMADLLSRYDNLVILRTFSKWAGLAGLRIGYALCPDWLAAELMKIKTPYNVNAVGQAAVVATFDEFPVAAERVQALVAEVPRMAAALGETGLLAPYPTDANFVLFRSLLIPAEELKQRLLERGIFVRHYTESRLADCIRISAGRPEDTERLIAAINAIKETLS